MTRQEEEEELGGGGHRFVFRDMDKKKRKVALTHEGVLKKIKKTTIPAAAASHLFLERTTA